jgi:hypothetical protein
MTKYLLSILAVAAFAFALCADSPSPLLSIRATDDAQIDVMRSADMGQYATTNDLASAIASATNALATVAHTGSYTNLVDRPIDIRATVDGDGVTRYRIFTNTNTP